MTLRKKCLFFLLTLSLACLMAAEAAPANQPSAAPAGGQGFGVVDFLTCVTLHPLMAAYDFSAGRFRRDGVNWGDPKSVEMLGKKLSELQAALRPKVQEVDRKIGEVQRELAEFNLRRDQTALSLSRAAGEKKNVARETYDRELAANQQRYDAKIAEAKQRMTALEQTRQKLHDDALAPIFLNSAESAARLQQILGETDQAVREVAAGSGMAVIIDDSYGTPAGQTDQGSFSSPPDPMITGNTIYQMIIQSPFPNPKNPQDKMAYHFLGDMQKSLQGMTRQHLARRQELVPFVANMTGGRLFLAGGADLTLSVCERLYTRYRMNPYLIQTLKAALTDFRRQR